MQDDGATDDDEDTTDEDTTDVNTGGPCEPSDVRRCSGPDLRGTCAGGEQECDVNGEWGECSIQPADMDSCEPGNDDTCNGIANEGCACDDGDERDCSLGGYQGPCAEGTQVCQDDAWGECSILPAASDSCEPGNDDNCNGIANEGCVCLEGDVENCGEASGLLGTCADGEQTCDANGEWGSCSIPPSVADTCEPGNDDNCNGSQNDGCPCTQGDTRDCDQGGYFGPCASGTQTCLSDGSWSGCSFAPQAYDNCAAGNDDNCDGVANSPLDPACDCVGGTSRSCSAGGLLGPCANGTQTCSASGQWGTCSIAPAASDTCTAGNDANCNGTPNEDCDCLVGEVECVAATPSTERRACTANGTWGSPTSCQYVCTGAGVCGGSCSPGERECNGNTPRECEVDGEWQSEIACGGSTPCQGAGVCQACPSGTYASAGQCVTWSDCVAGQYVSSAGTSTTDRQCSPCAAGTYSTGANAMSCTAWTTCSAGQYVSSAGTTASDRQCTGCTSGTYSTTTNATTCTSCAAGMYSAAGASSCTTCTTCADDYFEVRACASGKDRTCGAQWAHWPMPNPASTDYTVSTDTVVDNVTDLMWQRAVPEAQYEWVNAKTYCNDLVLAGHSDWRLPSRIELVSLVDFTRVDLAIDTTAFPNTPGHFWTSSPHVGTLHAWFVNFAWGGYTASYDVTSAGHVRCVRDSQVQTQLPPDRYTFSGTSPNDTVTDTRTGLVWQRTHGPNHTFAGAQSYCSGLSLQGSGWRVPDMKELQTLVDETRTDLAIDVDAFPDTTGPYFWTSSPSVDPTAWYVSFYDGSAGNGYDVTAPLRVRCVR